MIVCLCAFSLALTSCERELESEIVSTTPPALQVNVKDAANQPFAGATVQLYADETAWTNEATPMLSKQTAADGSIVFTRQELGNPGFFYLIATDGTLKVKQKTPYLLLTDGKTYFNVVLK